MRTVFLRAQNEKLFFAQIGQTVNSVWKISAHRLGLNFVGEIEKQIFFLHKRCVPASF